MLARRLFLLVLLVSNIVSLASAGVVDELSEKSQALRELSGTFEQIRHIEGVPLPLVSQGKFYYHRQQGIQWQTLAPVSNEIIIREDGLYTLSSQDEEPIQSGHAVMAEILLSIFSGNLAALQQHFEIEEKDGEQQGWVLQLTPLNHGLANYLRLIEIDGQDYAEEIRLIEASGNSTHITLDVDQVVVESQQNP